MDKEDMVHMHNEILFNLKENEVLPFLTTWKNREGIMLSEISQA